MTYHDLLKQERPMPPQKETAMSDSIPDLVARVQAIEARVCSVEAAQKRPNFKVVERPPVYWNEDADLSTILGKRDGETIEDAARRVVDECDALGQMFVEISQALGTGNDESVRNAARRVVAERDEAVKERDEAVRLFHGIEVSYFGFGRLRAYGTSVEIRRLLARHGLAEDHSDGTFTLAEPKP
jgi:hypothetical protein